MTNTNPGNNPPLPISDRQLLETIGKKALYKTRKTLIARDNKQIIKKTLK